MHLSLSLLVGVAVQILSEENCRDALKEREEKKSSGGRNEVEIRGQPSKQSRRPWAREKGVSDRSFPIVGVSLPHCLNIQSRGRTHLFGMRRENINRLGREGRHLHSAGFVSLFCFFFLFQEPLAIIDRKGSYSLRRLPSMFVRRSLNLAFKRCTV